MNAIWAFGIVFLVSVNSLAAVLYAGVPAIDDGGGFITLSPLVDCILGGGIIVVSGIVTLVLLRRYWAAGKRCPPKIPMLLRFPAAYLAALAGLSIVVLLLGIVGAFDRFDAIHLPFWGYISLMALLYLVCGFFWGKLCYAPAWTGIFWGICIAGLLGAMGARLLHDANARDAYWQAQSVGIYIPSYTESLMDSAIGAVLGRVNLPGCVIMDTYAYARFENLGGCHTFSRDTVTIWVCLCPPILFTISWLLGRLRPFAMKRGSNT